MYHNVMISSFPYPLKVVPSLTAHQTIICVSLTANDQWSMANGQRQIDIRQLTRFTSCYHANTITFFILGLTGKLRVKIVPYLLMRYQKMRTPTRALDMMCNTMVTRW